MRWRWLPLAVVLAASPAAGQTLVDGLPAPLHGESFREGVALGLYFESEAARVDGFLWEMANAGADSVLLVLPWEQENVVANAVARGERTPSDMTVRAAVRSARALGLDVAIMPILQIQSRGTGEWRGVLAPEDVDAWFASYGAFIGHYASLAAEEQVTALSVGSELGSMERYASRWRELIDETRATFEGEVFYSANWDNYFNTPFWDAVDFVGLTGYHELAGEAGADVETLVAGWEGFVTALRVFAEGTGHEVVLTEVGYVSQADAAVHPWDYTVDGPVELAAQLDCYTAMYRAWYDQDWLAGVFLWNWFGDGGSADNGYTPRQKPAEQVVRHWYGAHVSGSEAP